MRTNPNGMVLWQDDNRVCIITGFSRWSENEKTGPMLQSWILAKQMDPFKAAMEGKDELVCGNCPLRGDHGKGRLCYVNLATAPHHVWHAWKRGDYPWLSDMSLFKGRTLRLGSYGDPVVVPVDYWLNTISHCDGHTGYSHQWRDHPSYRSFLMASCDSAAEQIDATSQGWRTFRVKREWQPKFVDEVVCPASEEGGRKTNCHNCRLCSGSSTKAKSVVINAHGRMAAYFE